MDPAKGPLVLIGGRPGNKVWVNPDGLGGDTWIEQLLPPAAQRWGSTCYNGIVALNSTAGIAAYDESGSRRTTPSRSPSRRSIGRSSPSGFGTHLFEYMQTYLIGRGEGGKAAPVFL